MVICAGASDRTPSPGVAVRWIVIALLFGLAACGTKRAEQPEPPRPAMTVMASYTDTSAFPHLRFEDGAISLNDRCPVRRVKLNRKMPPVFVNGRPVGFC